MVDIDKETGVKALIAGQTNRSIRLSNINTQLTNLFDDLKSFTKTLDDSFTNIDYQDKLTEHLEKDIRIFLGGITRPVLEKYTQSNNFSNTIKGSHKYTYVNYEPGMTLKKDHICLVNCVYIVLGTEENQITVYYPGNLSEPSVGDSSVSWFAFLLDIDIKGQSTFVKYSETGYVSIFGSLIVLKSLIKCGDVYHYKQYIKNTYDDLRSGIQADK